MVLEERVIDRHLPIRMLESILEGPSTSIERKQQ